MSTCKTHSLLEFVPKTGRKHQLRLMSAQALRAPIVGDWKYGWRGPEEMNGHLLHAADIQFYVHASPTTQVCKTDGKAPVLAQDGQTANGPG